MNINVREDIRSPVTKCCLGNADKEMRDLLMRSFLVEIDDAVVLVPLDVVPEVLTSLYRE